MDRNKIVALVMAVLAALLVMWAGKSCAEDIAGKRTGGGGKEPSVGFSATKPPAIATADPGALNDAEVAGSEGQKQDLNDAAVGTEDSGIEVVTDMLGRVEATIIKETVPPENAPTVQDGTAATKSMLDEYNEKQNSGADSISGFNHGSGGNSDSATEPAQVKQDPTLPPDFSLIIN